MNDKLKILHLEDLVSDAEFVARELKKANIASDILVVGTKQEYQKALNDFSPDIILCDHSLSSFDSFDALTILKQKNLNLPFILVTATMSDEAAAELMKRGATDYILKDRLKRLPKAVMNAIETKRVEDEKRESEERYRLVTENPLLGIAWMGDDSKIMHANDTFCKMLGYKYSELMKLDSSVLTHPDDIEKERLLIDKIKRKEIDNFIIEKKCITKKKKTIWIQINFSCIRNNDESVKYFIKVIQDITSKKMAEKNLEKSYKEISDYKLALDKSTLLSITDAKGRIIHANKLFCNTLKYTKKELVGNTHRMVNSGHHSQEFFSELWRTIEHGKIWYGEIKNKSKEGLYFWANTTIVPFLNEKGKSYRYLAIMSDVTVRKKAEENLRKSETRLKEAQEMAHVGNWEIDFATNEQIWSDELYNMFGVKKEEVKASTELFLSFMHQEDKDFARQQVAESLKSFKTTGFGFRFIKKDGTIRYGESEAKFEFDEKGKPLRLHGIVQDVTERRKAEEERIKMIEDILQRNKNLEQFSYIISHNLRMPVANIMGITDLLQSGDLPKETREALNEKLYQSVTKLDEVIKDLNNILHLKESIGEEKQLVNFSKLVKHIRESMEDVFVKEGMTISCDFTEVGEMMTIQGYLYSIFYNLISNSLKYKQPNIPAIITIKSKKLRDKIILIFKDNGIGIDLVKKGEQVFGLYKRFHTDRAEGKGMGLFMVKTQVENLGGTISIHSEVNKGTEFKIEFKV